MRRKGAEESKGVRERSRTVGEAGDAGIVANTEIKNALVRGARNIDVRQFSDLLRKDMTTEARFKQLASLGGSILLLAEAYKAAIEIDKGIPATSAHATAKMEMHEMLKDIKHKIEYCDVLLTAVVSREEVQVAKDQSMIIDRTVSKIINEDTPMISEPMMLSYSKANAMYVEARAITAEAAFDSFSQLEIDHLSAKTGAIDDRATKEIQQRGQIAISELHSASNKQVLELKGVKELSDTEKEFKAESPIRLRKNDVLKEKRSSVGLLRNISSSKLLSANNASETFMATVKRVSNAGENSVIHYRTMRQAYTALDTDIRKLPQKYIDASGVYSKVETLEKSIENRRLEAAEVKSFLLKRDDLNVELKQAIAREDLSLIREIVRSLKDPAEQLKSQLMGGLDEKNPLKDAINEEDISAMKKLSENFDGDKELLKQFIKELEEKKPIIEKLENYVNSIDQINQQSTELEGCREHVQVFDQFKLVDPSLRDEISQAQTDRQQAKGVQTAASSGLKNHFNVALDSLRDQIAEAKKTNQDPQGAQSSHLHSLEENYKMKRAELRIVTNYLGELSEYQQKGKVAEEEFKKAEKACDVLMKTQPEPIQRQWQILKESASEFNTANQRFVDVKARRDQILEAQPCGVLNLTNNNNKVATLHESVVVIENLQGRSVAYQDTKRDLEAINESRGVLRRDIKMADYLDLPSDEKAGLKSGIDFMRYNDTVKTHILFEHRSEFREFAAKKSRSEESVEKALQKDDTENESTKKPPENDAERRARYENEFVMMKLTQAQSEDATIRSMSSAGAEGLKQGSIVSRAFYVEAQRTQQVLKAQFQDTEVPKLSPVLSHTSPEANTQRSSYGALVAQMGGANRQRSESMQNAPPEKPPSITVTAANTVKNDSANTAQSQNIVAKSSVEKEDDRSYESSSTSFGNSGS